MSINTITRSIHFASILFVSLFVVLTTIAQLPLDGIRCSLEPQKPIDGFQMPVLAIGKQTWRISNSFGNRLTNDDLCPPNNGITQKCLPPGYWQHTGDDFILGNITQSQSEPVYAIGNGVVIFSTKGNKNPNSPRGGLVIIRHVAPAGSKFIVSQYDGAAGKYVEFETPEVFSYYLHLNPDQIFVNQNDPVVKGKQIAELYSFADQKRLKLVYPPHLHLEIWSTCGKADAKGKITELNGYEPDGTLKNSLKNPVIDPDSFLSNVRLTRPLPPLTSHWQVRFNVNESWHNTGIAVKRGQTLNVSASGWFLWDPNLTSRGYAYAGPEGVPYNARRIHDPNDFPIPDANVASLVMRIDGSLYAIGKQSRVNVNEDGNIEFMINDRNNGLDDNSGELAVSIDDSPTSPSQNSGRYLVRIYNVDDFAGVFVNGKPVIQIGYKDTREVDITPFLRPGKNEIRFVVKNMQEKYTYGFVLFRDNKSIFRDECGIIGFSGCNGSEQTGIVYDRTITIDY